MEFVTRLVWGAAFIMAAFIVVVGGYRLATGATWEQLEWWSGLAILSVELSGMAVLLILSWITPTLVVVIPTMLATLWCAKIRPKVCASILLVGTIGYFTDIILVEHDDRHVVVVNGNHTREVEILGLRNPFSEQVVRMEFRKKFEHTVGFRKYMVETTVIHPEQTAKMALERDKTGPYKQPPRFFNSWTDIELATKPLVYKITNGEDVWSTVRDNGLHIELFEERTY